MTVASSNDIHHSNSKKRTLHLRSKSSISHLNLTTQENNKIISRPPCTLEEKLYQKIKDVEFN